MYYRTLHFGAVNNIFLYLRRYLNEILKLKPPLVETSNRFDNELNKAIQQFLLLFNTRYPDKKLPVLPGIDNKVWAAVGIMLGEARLREEIKTLRDPVVVKLLQGLPTSEPVVYTAAMAACDQKIARLFGAVGAEAATAVDINVPIGQFKGRTADRSEHLYKDGVFHLYTDEKGTDKKVELYVPKEAKFVPPTGRPHGEYEQKNCSQEKCYVNDFSFHFDKGLYKGVTVIFVHVAGTYGGEHGGGFLGKEFINAKNELLFLDQTKTRFQIGYIGGLGGEADTYGLYKHCHVVVKRNGRRIDPRTIFC